MSTWPLQAAVSRVRASLPVITYLELHLQVLLKEPPILVDLVVVRWARGSHLGVEFLSLRPEHQARLQRMVEQAL